MLTKPEYLLNLVMEECAEVAQRCSKAKRFGLEERQPGHYNNAERIILELIDLTETVDELIDEGYLKMPEGVELEVLRVARRQKMAKYLARAQAEGRVEA